MRSLCILVLAARAAFAAELPVDISLVEMHVVIDANGTSTNELREVYQLRVSQPPGEWSFAYAHWQPWIESPPELSARVTAPDGTAVALDPSTVADRAQQRDDGTVSDAKLRLAPLPGLMVGAKVERQVRLVRRSQFGEGGGVLVPLAFTLPVKLFRIVVELPRDAPVHFRTFGADVRPKRELRDGRVVLTFERKDVAAVVPAALSAPAEASLRVSTVRSWQAVARSWGARAEEGAASADVRALAEKITVGRSTRDDRVRALLEWLRANVRYTGVELGESAWVPFRPSVVLSRKYGDCKDLSLLLVTMARAVGVDAQVALVRTTSHDVTDDVPGFGGFDHAIVRIGGGAPVWLDPTNPLLGYGELSPMLLGRRALVIAPSTKGLEPLVSRPVSRLRADIDTTLSEVGPARVRVRRTTEGWMFASGRELMARSPDGYRRAVERLAKENHRSTQPAVISTDGEPLGTGPFSESWELADSIVGVTEGEDSQAWFGSDDAFIPLEAVFSLHKAGSLAARVEPIRLNSEGTAEVCNHFRPSRGFRSAVPEEIKETFGPVAVRLEWKRVADDGLDGCLRVAYRAGNLSAKDAQSLIDRVSKLGALQIKFTDGALEELRNNRLYAAVQEAQRTFDAEPTPRHRAKIAYVLASVGLMGLATQEANRALADAPNDTLVGLRAAFVALYNDRGVERGKGFSRKRMRELLTPILQRAPNDEWALRLWALAAIHSTDGTLLGEGVDLAEATRALLDYREKTKNDRLDDHLVELRLRQRDWKTAVVEMPKLKASPARDALWLAAEAVAVGPEVALKKAKSESRAAEGVIPVAMQMLMVSRQYDVALTWLTISNISGPPVDVLRKLRAGAPAEEPKAVIARYMKLLGDRKLSRKDLEPVLTDVNTELPTSSDVMANAAVAQAPKGALLGDYLHDVILGVSTVDIVNVPGAGELVNLKVAIPGSGALGVIAVVRTPRGYRIVPDPDALVGAAVIKAIDSGNETETRRLIDAMALLKADFANGVGSPAWSVWAPFFAAGLAANNSKTAPVAEAWLQKRLASVTSAELGGALAACTRVWAGDAKRRAALAKSLALRFPNNPELAEFEADALRDQGAFADARRRIDEQLNAGLGNVLLERKRAALLAESGEFAKSRTATLKLAESSDSKEQARLLNNAAWLSLFVKADEDARMQATRSVQAEPSPARWNTLAVVCAELGHWDDALVAFRQQTTTDTRPLNGAYWYAQGRIAEALGRPGFAVEAYRRVTPQKNAPADDVFVLAAARLKALAAQSGGR